MCGSFLVIRSCCGEQWVGVAAHVGAERSFTSDHLPNTQTGAFNLFLLFYLVL